MDKIELIHHYHRVSSWQETIIIIIIILRIPSSSRLKPNGAADQSNGGTVLVAVRLVDWPAGRMFESVSASLASASIAPVAGRRLAPIDTSRRQRGKEAGPQVAGLTDRCAPERFTAKVASFCRPGLAR